MAAQKKSTQKAAFGQVLGREVSLFTLTNQNGLVLKATNYGAILTELWVPDRAGALGDVVLGFESLQGYLSSNWFFGAIVGRVANRIGNARFELDGQSYPLFANDGPHTLHGGARGFDKVVWEAELEDRPEGPAVVFSYLSPDGEEGFPGAVRVQAAYLLSHENEFQVLLTATTDRVTVINLAHHSYWNLGGPGSASILDHELLLFASGITPGENRVPTGSVVPVLGSPFDFSEKKPIGRDLFQVAADPPGYDHNFVVDGEPSKLRPVARVSDPRSGRRMALFANQPGVQFYSGNFLNGSTRGKGLQHTQHSGLCLETQSFPNAVNVPVWQDQCRLLPGRRYEHRMVHRFTAG